MAPRALHSRGIWCVIQLLNKISSAVARDGANSLTPLDTVQKHCCWCRRYDHDYDRHKTMIMLSGLWNMHTLVWVCLCVLAGCACNRSGRVHTICAGFVQSTRCEARTTLTTTTTLHQSQPGHQQLLVIIAGLLVVVVGAQTQHNPRPSAVRCTRDTRRRTQTQTTRGASVVLPLLCQPSGQ